MSNPFDEDEEEVSIEIAPRASSLPPASSFKSVVRNPISSSSSKQTKQYNVVASSYLEAEVKCCDSNDENAVIKFLVSERVYGYPGTSGGMLSNYCSFVCNTHPLLSICFSHKKHPYTKRKRLLVYFLVLIFAIFVSFLLLRTYYLDKLSVCKAGCNKQTVKQADGTYQNTCIGGSNSGLSASSYDSECHYYSPLLLSAATGAVLVPYAAFLKFFSTCSCLQGKAFFQEDCCGTRVKAFVEYIGGKTLTFFSFLSFFMIFYTTITNAMYYGNDFSIFQTFLLSKLWSAGFWFIWSLPMFLFKYPCDKADFYRRLARRREKQLQNASSKA